MRLAILFFLFSSFCWASTCATDFGNLYRHLLAWHRPEQPLIINQNDPALVDKTRLCSIVNSLHIAQTALAAAGKAPITDLPAHVKTLASYWDQHYGGNFRGLTPAQHAETTDAVLKRFLPGSTSTSHVQTLPLEKASPSPIVTELTSLSIGLLTPAPARPNQVVSKTVSLIGMNEHGVCMQHSVLVIGSGTRAKDGMPYLEVADPNFPDRPYKLAMRPLTIDEYNGHSNVRTVELGFLDGVNPYASWPVFPRGFVVNAVTTTTISLPAPR